VSKAVDTQRYDALTNDGDEEDAHPKSYTPDKS